MEALGRRLEAAQDEYAHYLQTASGLAAIAAGKRARDELIAAAGGVHVLDVGCGLGEDARRLADRLLPDGRVTGVDVSTAMLDQARAASGQVTWVAGDAHDLPFADATFDAARAERMLQHLDRPDVAVREMARVVRPGGIVVTCEPDWASIVVSGARQDLVDHLEDAAEAAIRHPRVGRALAGLLADAGVSRVEVVAEALVVRDADLLEVLMDLRALVAAAVTDGRLTAADAAALVDEVRAEAARGRLVCAMTLFTAHGAVA